MRSFQSRVDYNMNMRMEGNFQTDMCHKVFIGCILMEKPVGVGKIRWKLTETSQEAGGNIGYAISRQYRGHGYGTILLKSLIDIAKFGNCPELLATVKKYNYASKHVMEKCSGELVRETDERWYYRLG